MAKSKNSNKLDQNGAMLGFEEKLWEAADKQRGHMDAVEYKHVVLSMGLRKATVMLVSIACYQHFPAKSAESAHPVQPSGQC